LLAHGFAAKIAGESSIASIPNSSDLIKRMLDPRRAELLEKEFISAVKNGNTDCLRDIYKFCKIFESKTYGRSSQRKRDPLPWEYFAAVAALGSLTKGVIPTKKEVKEAALEERATWELPVMYQVGTKEPLPKLKEAGEPKEMRIDPEPALDRDPDNYYGTDWDEPEHDLPLKTSTKEEKPTLKQQRAKQIADRIEELRREHTPSTWRHIWKRVLRNNLGLSDLPRTCQ
jgi:hypothetical protein